MTAGASSLPSRTSLLPIPLPRPSLARMPMWAGPMAIGVGLVVLLGWVLGIDALKSMIPGVLTMKANTAVCFMLLGGGLVLLARADAHHAASRLGPALIWATLAIVVATSLQYVTGRDFGPSRRELSLARVDVAHAT